MLRWNLAARNRVPESQLVAPREGGEGRGLTPAEILEARLQLAVEMVHLVLKDGDGLPLLAQEKLVIVRGDLLSLWRNCRSF
jgi:hypothetical protein